MTKPTIHLNGTSADDLINAYEAAMSAISKAQEKLSETCPNGRDYYPQGEGAGQKARAEHGARMEKLEEVRTELEELCLHCLDEQAARAAMKRNVA